MKERVWLLHLIPVYVSITRGSEAESHLLQCRAHKQKEQKNLLHRNRKLTVKLGDVGVMWGGLHKCPGSLYASNSSYLFCVAEKWEGRWVRILSLQAPSSESDLCLFFGAWWAGLTSTVSQQGECHFCWLVAELQEFQLGMFMWKALHHLLPSSGWITTA